MKRASELIPGSQDTNSQKPYRTHTLVTCRVCIETEQPLKFNQPREIHSSDRTPNEKRIAVEPQPKRENTKTIEKEKEKKKRKRKMIKIGVSIGISGIIQSESRAQSEGPIKA